MPQALKIPVAKVVVDKELENWRNFVMERDKSQKEEVIDEAITSGAKDHFASTMVYVT